MVSAFGLVVTVMVSGLDVIVTIMVSIGLLLMSSVIIAGTGDEIVSVMTWKIAFAMVSLIIIRSFTVIVSVHNGIFAAITSGTGIIGIVAWIMDASGKQQRKNDQQCFFSDCIHISPSVMVNNPS